MMAWVRLGRIASVAAAAVFLFAAGSAQAAGWLEKGIYMSGANYDGVLPGCEAALGTISSRFETRETRFWNSNLQIVGYDRVRQIAFSPWARGTIPRRFCTAMADMNDGKRRRVDFYIAEDGGEIGATWGVTWCVAGLDRNMAYSPNCKMARP